MAKAVYTAEVLEEAPTKAAQFITGLNRSPLARMTLAPYGLTEDVMRSGRALLDAALKAVVHLPVTQVPGRDDARVAAAFKELMGWAAPHLGLVRAVLTDFDLTHQSDVTDFALYEVHSPTSEAGAAENVARLLAHLDVLEAGTEATRQASRALDQQAVAELTAHGLPRAERDRVKGLVDLVLGPTPTGVVVTVDITEREATLTALKRWLDKWSGIARSFIHRRDILIVLGLAHRHSPASADDGSTDGQAPPVTPPAQVIPQVGKAQSR